MKSQSLSRSSASALFAFIATAALIFGYTGINLGERLADATLPEAKRYIEKGGSIDTIKLDKYHRFPLVGFFLCGAVGAIAGWGFYSVWQRS